jgi:hypothetical protein
MPVTMSDADFDFVLAVLRRMHLPYGSDEVGEIVGLEREAWVRFERVAAQHGWEPPNELLAQRLAFVTGPKIDNSPYRAKQ